MEQNPQSKLGNNFKLKRRNRVSRVEKLLAFVMALFVLGSSIALIVHYSLNIFHTNEAANAAATVSSLTRIAYHATEIPTETAIASAKETATDFANNTTATAIVQTNATAQVEASASPVVYPPYGETLVLDDPLTGTSKGYQWEVSFDYYGSCGFAGGTYQVVSKVGGTFEYCLARPTNYANFIYQVQMTIIKGDGGGLIIRADDKGNKFYRFLVNQDGSYRFSVFDLMEDTVGTTLISSSNPVINTGQHTPNIIALVVHGNVFELYVNLHRIAIVGDYNYNQGAIGVFAAAEEVPLTAVIFQNAKVWLVS